MQQGEAKFVNEYLDKNYPDALQWTRVRLGKWEDTPEGRMYAVTSRWADAVVVADGRVAIIEAKLEPALTGITQLELYKQLFRQTPQFKAYWNLPITLIYLTTRGAEDIQMLCSQRNISYEVYKPLWYQGRR